MLRHPSPRPFSLTRRTVLKYSAGSAAALAFNRLARAADTGKFDPSPVVQVSAGRIRGYLSEGINVFKGIPYGASTGGVNRFLPPKKPLPWSGVRKTVQYGPWAMQ